MPSLNLHSNHVIQYSLSTSVFAKCWWDFPCISTLYRLEIGFLFCRHLWLCWSSFSWWMKLRFEASANILFGLSASVSHTSWSRESRHATAMSSFQSPRVHICKITQIWIQVICNILITSNPCQIQVPFAKLQLKTEPFAKSVIIPMGTSLKLKTCGKWHKNNTNEKNEKNRKTSQKEGPHLVMAAEVSQIFALQTGIGLQQLPAEQLHLRRLETKPKRRRKVWTPNRRVSKIEKIALKKPKKDSKIFQGLLKGLEKRTSHSSRSPQQYN